MTASLPAHDVPRELQRDVRRAMRDTQHPIIGGVAGGLARHLGGPGRLGPGGVPGRRRARAASGSLFYAGLWLVLPAEPPFDARGTRASRAPPARARRPGRIRRLADSGPAIALVALGLGLVLDRRGDLRQRRRDLGRWSSPCVGFGLLWRQADEAQRARWLDQSERLNPVRAVFGAGGWAAYLRVGAGFVLVAGAVALFAVRDGHVRDVYDVLVAAALGGIGLGDHPRAVGLAAHQRPVRPSAPSGCAPRSAPTSPPTSTTRSCRPSP